MSITFRSSLVNQCMIIATMFTIKKNCHATVVIKYFVKTTIIKSSGKNVFSQLLLYSTLKAIADTVRASSSMSQTPTC